MNTNTNINEKPRSRKPRALFVKRKAKSPLAVIGQQIFAEPTTTIAEVLKQSVQNANK